jgi:hypothetical protein
MPAGRVASDHVVRVMRKMLSHDLSDDFHSAARPFPATNSYTPRKSKGDRHNGDKLNAAR